MDEQIAAEIFDDIVKSGKFRLSAQQTRHKICANALKELGYITNTTLNKWTFLPTPNLGDKVVAAGGWNHYKLATKSKGEREDLKESLEIELAKSNLRAAEILERSEERSERDSRRNHITTIINIIVGLINIGILVWQSLKAGQ